MDKQLRIIANAILSNLENTERIGLMDGKMGVCLFLYQYFRHIGISLYGELAEKLLDDIYNTSTEAYAMGMCDGYAGVGWGLVHLMENRYICGNINEVLSDIDKHVLDRPQEVLLEDLCFNMPVFTSGIYLIKRLAFADSKQQRKWIKKIIKVGNNYLKNLIDERALFPALYGNVCTTQTATKGLVQSMLYTFTQLSLINTIDNPIYKDLEIICGRVTDVANYARLNDDIKESSLTSTWPNPQPLWLKVLHQENTELLLNGIDIYLQQIIAEGNYHQEKVCSFLSAIGIIILNQIKKYEKS